MGHFTSIVTTLTRSPRTLVFRNTPQYYWILSLISVLLTWQRRTGTNRISFFPAAEHVGLDGAPGHLRVPGLAQVSTCIDRATLGQAGPAQRLAALGRRSLPGRTLRPRSMGVHLCKPGCAASVACQGLHRGLGCWRPNTTQHSSWLEMLTLAKLPATPPPG